MQYYIHLKPVRGVKNPKEKKDTREKTKQDRKQNMREREREREREGGGVPGCAYFISVIHDSKGKGSCCC